MIVICLGWALMLKVCKKTLLSWPTSMKMTEEKDHMLNGMNFAEEFVINRNQNGAEVPQVSANSRVTDASGPLDGVTGGDCAGQKPRARHLLDEQFDLLEVKYMDLMMTMMMRVIIIKKIKLMRMSPLLRSSNSILTTM
ncbi:LTV1-like isoform X1 [Spatholobus suberectus]|nr:LTV1-like isoform X1 [Spatholobus suberectus]